MYYTRRKKKYFFDTHNPNRFTASDLLERFDIANQKEREEYKQELINEQITLLTDTWLKIVRDPIFIESNDIYAQSFIDGDIEIVFEIDEENFNTYLEENKHWIISKIESSDFSSEKLSSYIYELILSIKEKKGKIKLSLRDFRIDDIGKDIFLLWIILLAIEGKISILEYWEYLEVDIIEQDTLENIIENPEEELKELYSTLYSMIQDKQYKEITLKKDRDWVGDTIEARKHIERNGNKFIDLQKQHPYADIQAKVHKWNIQKYSVLEKIRLDKKKK